MEHGHMEHDHDVPERRRDRHRRELVDQICDVARTQLAAGGPTAVTWRGIAREVGMGPASLYTYFASLDELFTELIVQSFRSLAAAVEQALDAFAASAVGDRLLIGPLAYRHWSLTHPGEFNLIFTDVLPDFAAAPGGPTVEAQTAIFRPMAGALAEARAEAAGVSVEELGDPMARSGAGIETFIGLWGIFHGLTSLQVNHHLDWLDADAMFESRMRWGLDAAGLPGATPDTVPRFVEWASDVTGTVAT